MKLSTLLISFAPTALALPATGAGDGVLSTVSKRQDTNAITDQLLFILSLPDFIARRDAQDPSNLDWTSDGCTSAPDNPFGFPFLPGCYRHDFGYQNYRLESRFTQSNKLSIDNKFKSDLFDQCDLDWVHAKTPCILLAEVYYIAVRLFGGTDATPDKRDESREELLRLYEEKLELYHQAVKEAQAKGLLPILE